MSANPSPEIPSASHRPNRTDWLLSGTTVVLALLHGYAIWVALEGASGLTNGWPLWREDHPLFFHYSLVTRSFLRQSWTTAGYDPTFMAGHAKSIIFPPSATLSELVVAAFGGDRPELAYKLYVLVSAAAIPWLIALASWLWRLGPGGTLGAIALFLLYVWTDFPIGYAGIGMLPLPAGDSAWTRCDGSVSPLLRTREGCPKSCRGAVSRRRWDFGCHGLYPTRAARAIAFTGSEYGTRGTLDPTNEP